MAKKFRCTVCGYIHEGDAAPEKCPLCKVPAEKFVEQKGEMGWAAEHIVGVAQGAPEEIMEGLRANFMGECTEVGMYLAMARVAHREGYPEIGLYWEKAAYYHQMQIIFPMLLQRLLVRAALFSIIFEANGSKIKG